MPCGPEPLSSILPQRVRCFAGRLDPWRKVEIISPWRDGDEVRFAQQVLIAALIKTERVGSGEFLIAILAKPFGVTSVVPKADVGHADLRVRDVNRLELHVEAASCEPRLRRIAIHPDDVEPVHRAFAFSLIKKVAPEGEGADLGSGVGELGQMRLHRVVEGFVRVDANHPIRFEFRQSTIQSNVIPRVVPVAFSRRRSPKDLQNLGVLGKDFSRAVGAAVV